MEENESTAKIAGPALSQIRSVLAGAKVEDVWIDSELMYLVFDNGYMVRTTGEMSMAHRKYA